MNEAPTYTAFAGDQRVASGDLATTLRAAKAYLDRRPRAQLLIFDDSTGRQVDFDLRGSADEVVARALPPQPERRPGRPRLGVVAREVTLLPRHWEWLAEQPSGASATLRRLVDEARRHETPAARAKRSAAISGRAMTVLAGDRPGFEEAYRALDAGDRARFEELTRDWPAGVRDYLLELAGPALDLQP